MCQVGGMWKKRLNGSTPFGGVESGDSWGQSVSAHYDSILCNNLIACKFQADIQLNIWSFHLDETVLLAPAGDKAARPQF